MTKHEPMYIRIRNHILDGIHSGTYRHGDKLPSEKELAAQFGTTRSTVVHGLQTLASDGVISREIGRGTFVTPQLRRIPQDGRRVIEFDQEISKQGGKLTYRLLSFLLIPAPAEIAKKLGLESGVDVYKLSRIRLVDDVPTVEETRFLPVKLGDMMRIDDLSKLSMYYILGEKLGQPVARIEGVMRADAARDHTAQALGIKAGSPVLLREYVLLDADGNPIACGEAIFRREVEIAYSGEASPGDLSAFN